MEKLDLSKKGLKKFGITMGIAFLVIALLILIRHRHNPCPFFIVSALFFVLGVIFPSFLRPVYIFWMRLAYVLGWINTRLLLLAMFYLIFSPVGLFLRLMRIDPLKRAIDKEKDTYWIKKEDRVDYERQF
ncbi:MAG: SxtJ family membrane protein [Candidatus Omnitrophica bacterium]|nr:SxtJ family membrane protein [Candidatus Omnitrophota bacterium]